jgi:hypothetical protein
VENLALEARVESRVDSQRGPKTRAAAATRADTTTAGAATFTTRASVSPAREETARIAAKRWAAGNQRIVSTPALASSQCKARALTTMLPE